MKHSGKMVFQRFGRSYQLRLATAEDLANVLNLDESHWVATSVPINTIRCDATFLNHLDTDKNGRIRASNLKQAIGWLLDLLKDTMGVTKRSNLLGLDAINVDHPEGQVIYETAKKMLARLGLADDTQVSLDQIS